MKINSIAKMITSVFLAFVITISSGCVFTKTDSNIYVIFRDLEKGYPEKKVKVKADGTILPPGQKPTAADGSVFLGWYWSYDGGITMSDDPLTSSNIVDTNGLVALAKWGEPNPTYAFKQTYASIAPGVYGSSQSLKFDVDEETLFYTTDCSEPKVIYEGGQWLPANSSTRQYQKNSTIAIVNRANDGQNLTQKYNSSNQTSTSSVGSAAYLGEAVANYNRGTIIKTLACKGTQQSNVWTGTYIVWPNKSEQTYNLPTISMSMPEESWFGYSDGIYNHPQIEIEKICNFEFFDKDNNLIFNQDGQIKIGGAYTTYYPRKIFNVNLNKGEDNDWINYPMWSNQKLGDRSQALTRFKRFRLYSSGSARGSQAYSHHNFANKLFSPLEAETVSYIDVAVFLNGEYWGTYQLMENYNDRFFAEHYNLDSDNILQISWNNMLGVQVSGYVYGKMEEAFEIRDGYLSIGLTKMQSRQIANICSSNMDGPMYKLYWEMFHYAQQNTFYDDATYDYFAQNYLNVDTLIDLYITLMLTRNWDSFENNNRWWRAIESDSDALKKGDGRWNLMIHDFDQVSFSGNHTDFIESVFGTSTYSPSTHFYPYFTLYFRRCLQNEKFRNQFLNRFIYIYNDIIEQNRFTSIINEMQTSLSPMWTTHCNRWPDDGGRPSLSGVLPNASSFYSSATNMLNKLTSIFKSEIPFVQQQMGDGFKRQQVSLEAERFIPAHLKGLSTTTLTLTTATTEKANATALKFGLSTTTEEPNPATMVNIDYWYGKNGKTKTLTIYRNSWVYLSNKDNSFSHYEISGLSSTTLKITNRDYKFQIPSSGNINIVVVYD